MGHLSQTRVLVRLTKLQVNNTRTGKLIPLNRNKNLSNVQSPLDFAESEVLKQNCGNKKAAKSVEKITARRKIGKTALRLDSLVWDFDNGMNAKYFDEGAPSWSRFSNRILTHSVRFFFVRRAGAEINFIIKFIMCTSFDSPTAALASV